VRLWDVASGQLKATLKNAGRLLGFAPDGKTVATTAGPGVGVHLWDAASGQLTATLKDAGDLLAFSADGKTLAARDDSGKLLLWDVALARPVSPVGCASGLLVRDFAGGVAARPVR
jgi:WD40 repeat protein